VFMCGFELHKRGKEGILKYILYFVTRTKINIKTCIYIFTIESAFFPLVHLVVVS
jgi:hypothetical protein